MIKILRSIPLFNSVKEEQLISLITKNEIYLKNYKNGVTLYNQKEYCTTFDVILSGNLAAYSLSENGSSMNLFEFLQGQILGANLLFNPKGVYPFNIYCMADAEVLHVTKKAVEILLHDFDFTLDFIEMLSINSSRLNHKITMVTQGTLRENLLEYLRQESLLQNSNPLTLPISKKQLADYLGVQRPSLFRELKKLKEEGLIEVNNREIHLHYL
ncbi:MAG: Crp/Fnr family transcriptional regulator [Peptoniphilus sp.]|nr:Crp/Fnr family transcriptional regulator [Peptoniphilus sp.]